MTHAGKDITSRGGFAPPWLVALLLLTAACGGGDGQTPLDPDVPPVTEGDWYRPALAVTWQWQLSGPLDTSYDVEIYDVDLFDSDAATIAGLQAEGRRVICYFSGGSYEEWRPDAADLDEAARGDSLDDWEGERWLDIRDPSVHAVMLARLDLAVTKGCDGVEPDNMDGYDNDSGFDMGPIDQLAFNRFVANGAHERGMTVALKNDGAQVDDLVEYFDLSLNEQCHEYDECGDLAPFTAAGKPILNAEYPGSLAQAEARRAAICDAAAAAKTRTLLLPLLLDDSFRIACD
ncbi:MAG: endo alpha-1,4 polygalactosaminidase [Myxococcales bacterium]|nr:endo alpha-1,4 polygalactosaminidase [Myxococcales bacterium]